MVKKILTLDDLVLFCKQQKLTTFSSKDSGYQLRVQVPASFETDEEEELPSSTLFATVKLMHTGTNRNHSNLTEKAAKNCLSTIAYKPVLANFCEVDGERDFTSHDFEIDEDGKVVYLEKQVGCFTADKPYMEQDEDHEDRQYVYARVAIPRDYTDAADIIERKQGTKVSVELAINSLEYDSKNNELLLTDVEVMGVALLGKNPDTGENVQEGMEGARLDIEDFSAENNAIQFDQDVFIQKIIQGLKESFDNNNSKKGGNPMEIFEEKVEVTDTSDEEVVEEMTTEEEVVEEATTDEFTEEDNVAETESEETVEETPSEENEEEIEQFSKTITYSVSVSEMLSALTNLVNETYSADGTYYMVDAYEDTKSVVMIDMWTGKAYKQAYSVKKDVYSLKGDRCPVKAVYLTSDEEAKLDEMRSNYSSIQEKLDKYEAEPEKIELLNSEDYNGIKTTEEYAEIAKRENYFDMSKEDLAKSLDEVVLKYAKSGELKFGASEDAEQPKVNMKMIPIGKAKKSGRYGGLFSK